MATIKDLEKYINYEFSTGCYTGEDYKQFERKYINYLKSLCKENNWKLDKIGKNHYEFSLFIKNNEEKYVYLSISDVRYFQNEWYSHILIRTAINERDYHGGINNYCNLKELPDKLSQLFGYGQILYSPHYYNY